MPRQLGGGWAVKVNLVIMIVENGLLISKRIRRKALTFMDSWGRRAKETGSIPFFPAPGRQVLTLPENTQRVSCHSFPC